MRKPLDLLLMVLAVGALVFGAFELGRAVTRESNDAAVRSGGLTTTTTPASPGSSTTASSSDESRTIVYMGVAVIVGALLFMMGLSLLGSVKRSRRRERWRLR